MILSDLPPGTTLFRAHTPQWASRPISGAGAAGQGGRFNREGVEALYLSLDELTALREYQQTSPFLPPCTMCSYTATLRNLVDLRQLHQGEPWDELWHDWREDWRHLKLELHIEPPTWVLADMVRAQGHTGILFPSLLVSLNRGAAIPGDSAAQRTSPIAAFAPTPAPTSSAPPSAAPAAASPPPAPATSACWRPKR